MTGVNSEIPVEEKAIRISLIPVPVHGCLKAISYFMEDWVHLPLLQLKRPKYQTLVSIIVAVTSKYKAVLKYENYYKIYKRFMIS